MITTTLAQSKKLKELGFPQDFPGEGYDDDRAQWWCVDEDGEYHLIWVSNEEYRHDQVCDGEWKAEYLAVGLQELIEWLGEQFYQLEREAGDIWTVSGFGVIRGGETPLEAVYNLSLAVKGEK